VVRLDAVRDRLGVSPAGDQRAIARAAHDQARDLLRARRSFVWNATNVSRQQRDWCIGLAADYHARIRIVAVETSPATLRQRHQARPHPVPDSVIDRLITNGKRRT
jgi:predicted kinase